MKAVDWVILFLVGVWAVIAAVYLIRTKKKGGCSCSSCSGCSCSACDKRECKECPRQKAE